MIDSRDLARLVTILLEDDRPGAYNAVGESVTMAALIRACATSPVEIVPVPEDAEPRLPLVVADPALDVMLRRSAARARDVGMPVTPLAKTAADTLAWDRDRGVPALARDLSDERERELIATYR